MTPDRLAMPKARAPGSGGLVLDGVTKVFPGGVRAVDRVSLAIEEGEFMVLVGPSGCGKSTLLRMIAGLEEMSEGSILIGDRDVSEVPSRDRDIAMVFQNYALYPHMSVQRNLAYGLKVRKTPKAEIAERVASVARLLGLEETLGRRPSQLSGGQRQRVAMGRAIVREPRAFLMDEPLSNLDAKLRVVMRGELARLHSRLHTTTVYVTHDQVEAMTLGQRVAVMRDGCIQQVDVPQALYHSPVNLFVAAFIGSPSMNLVEGTIAGDTVAFAGLTLLLDPQQRPPPGGAERVIVGIRPEDFEDSSLGDATLPQFDATVAVLEELGPDAHIIFPIAAPRVEAEELRAAADHEDEGLLAEEYALFNARVDPRTRARVGDRIRLTIDPARLHFFSRETGEALTPGLRNASGTLDNDHRERTAPT
jgi:multiple sugar transport system ATP-binding protein